MAAQWAIAGGRELCPARRPDAVARLAPIGSASRYRRSARHQREPAVCVAPASSITSPPGIAGGCFLNRWYKWSILSLEPIMEAGRTIKKRRDGILPSSIATPITYLIAGKIDFRIPEIASNSSSARHRILQLHGRSQFKSWMKQRQRSAPHNLRRICLAEAHSNSVRCLGSSSEYRQLMIGKSQALWQSDAEPIE